MSFKFATSSSEFSYDFYYDQTKVDFGMIKFFSSSSTKQNRTQELMIAYLKSKHMHAAITIDLPSHLYPGRSAARIMLHKK